MNDVYLLRGFDSIRLRLSNFTDQQCPRVNATTCISPKALAGHPYAISHLSKTVTHSTYKSQHRRYSIRNLKRRLGLRPDLINRDALGELDERESGCEIDVKDAEIGDDPRNAGSAGEGECTLVQDLGASFLVDVFHGDDDFGLLRVRDEVHGAAEAFDFAGEHPCQGSC